MVGEKKKAALVRTTEDFASRTSIHGVAYVFDREHGLADRVLWILIVTAFLLLTGFFTHQSWIQWRDQQVTQLSLIPDNIWLNHLKIEIDSLHLNTLDNNSASTILNISDSTLHLGCNNLAPRL